VATEYLLRSDLGDRFEIVHLETADRRTLGNIGRFDWMNVVLAAVHGLHFLWLLLWRRPEIVYVPVAQNRLGYLRDCLFLVPARLLRKRVVVHIHGGYFGRFYAASGPIFRGLIRWTLAKAERVIVLGESLRPMLEGLVPGERVVCIPNGISDIEPGIRRRAAGGDSDFRVVYLGTLIRSKGFLDLLEAAREILRERTDVRFSFAGEFFGDSERAEAERYGADLGDRVEFVGVLSGRAKAQFLVDADLFVFPTYYPPEGHPYVILEAMAAGLPVVTTDHGAIAETVIDGETGVIVPQRAPAALAAVLRELLADPERRPRLGRAGRERFLACYTIDRWAERLAEVFDDVARAGR
jgi:glycosyltransferase involved in cell wall biosynthesis